MDQDKVLAHIIEIKSHMAAHEQRDEALRADVRRVLEVVEHGNVRIGALERQASKMETTVTIFQWMIGIFVAIGVGVVKAFKN